MGAEVGNEYALKYKNEKDLKLGIDEYFEDCDKRKKPYTMTGLANWLDIDRTTLINYGKREKFSTLVKKAKRKVEQQVEENILDGTFNTTAGIFNLKANYKWDDGNKIEVKTETPILNIEVVDNSNLEKVLYEENRPKQTDDK